MRCWKIYYQDWLIKDFSQVKYRFEDYIRDSNWKISMPIMEIKSF